MNLSRLIKDLNGQRQRQKDKSYIKHSPQFVCMLEKTKNLSKVI